jgi:FkbM family methyltransferase
MNRSLAAARSAAVKGVRALVGGPGSDWTMDRALRRIARRHEIATIIDVGASSGIWMAVARRHMPRARALLIEALADPHEAGLHALCLRDPLVDYVIAAAGDHEGTVHFDATDPFGGAASHEAYGNGDITVPMTTIDAEVGRRALHGPFLIKLDTHGFEAEVLSGAEATLQESAALVIEAYNFEIRPRVMRFGELIAFLESRGFRCIDLADPMRRPKDGVLWQMDLVFARDNRPEFSNPSYS